MPTMSELVSEYVALGGERPSTGRFRTIAQGEAKVAELRAEGEAAAARVRGVLEKHAARTAEGLNATQKGTARLLAALRRRPRLRDHPGLSKAARAILRRDIRRSKRVKLRRRKLARLARRRAA